MFKKCWYIVSSMSCISPQITSECRGSPISISSAKAFRGPLTISCVSVPILASPTHLVSGPKHGFSLFSAISKSYSAACFVDMYLGGR